MIVMANYPIGRLIAEMRNRQGISQEELAGNICSVSTVSKIENGAQMPKRKIYEALLQRLGMNPGSCTAYISEKEMRKYTLEAEIEQLIVNRQYDKVRMALEEYIMCDCDAGEKKGMESTEAYLDLCLQTGEGLSALEIQYVLYELAVLAQEQLKDRERALELYERAVRVTMPKHMRGQVPRSQLLSRQEIRIFCKMAALWYEKGERAQAKELLFFLKEYIEVRLGDPAEEFHTYPEILRLLAHWMGHDGRFDRQLELCERGIDLCAVQLKQCGLARLLEEKGHALAARMQYGQAESILKQAYSVYCAIGESANAERLRWKARNLFQIDIGSGS